MSRKPFAFLLTLCAATLLSAQDPPPQTEPPAQVPAALGPGRGALPTQEPQPYDKVITKDAKSKKGIFTVHQIKDKYYYEIPKSEFDK